MTNVYLTKTGTFTASHSHGGTLNEALHTHTFTYEVTFYGPLNAEGFLVDFRDVHYLLKKIVHPLENQNLRDRFPHPTTETICIWLFQEIQKQLPCLYSVKLAEEPDRWIIYKGEK